MKAPERLFVEVCEDGIFAFPEPPFEESVEYIRADLVPICPKQNDTESWNEDQNEDVMKLEEGIYDIPDNCTAVYANRQVIIKQKRPKSTILTCRNCKHQQYGRKSMQNQWWDSFYCDISPKIIAGKAGYYYNANPSKKACEKFEQKED